VICPLLSLESRQTATSEQLRDYFFGASEEKFSPSQIFEHRPHSNSAEAHASAQITPKPRSRPARMRARCSRYVLDTCARTVEDRDLVVSQPPWPLLRDKGTQFGSHIRRRHYTGVDCMMHVAVVSKATPAPQVTHKCIARCELASLIVTRRLL
jgi:hypothetical protein